MSSRSFREPEASGIFALNSISNIGLNVCETPQYCFGYSTLERRLEVTIYVVSEASGIVYSQPLALIPSNLRQSS